MKSYRDGFNDAERAILRAKDLTQQLLTFSRGGSAGKNYICDPVCVEGILPFCCHRIEYSM